MASMSKSLLTKLSVLLAFAATMVVNFMATTGKINGISTANVSDAHPTLLTPRGYTFSIWGIIYILLLLYVLFQLFSDKLSESGKHTKIAFWFVVSSIFNIGWIFAWHYEQIILSTVVMALLLYSLTHILSLVSETGHTFGNLISLELPFGLYAG